MKSQKTKSKPGFTLMELLLVVMIVVIVVGLSMSSLLQSQSVQVFNNSFGKLFSLVNNARSQAITGKGQLDFTDYDRDHLNHTNSDYVTPANYGVRFDVSGTPNVRLFADINPPLSGSTGSAGQFDMTGDYKTGKDLVLDSLDLPSTITLLVKDGDYSTPSSSSIFYSPNYADIQYEDLTMGASPFLKIQLTDTLTTACKQIKIHKLAGIPEVGQCD